MKLIIKLEFVEGVDGVYKWGNPDWGKSDDGVLVIDEESNITVDEDGLYFIKADTGAGTYSTTLMSLGLIESSATPTGWDSDTDFVYDATNNVLSLDINLTNGGEYKVRANNGWDIEFLDSLDQTQTEMVFLILKMVTLHMKELLATITCNIRRIYIQKVHIKSHRFVII